MRLTGFTFTKYKAFSGTESIEVRPLTIIIGRNNSGKSVISRLPMLIAHSFSDRAEGPLDLKFDDLDFGGSFLDLIYNKLPHSAIEIGASFVDDKKRKISFITRIQNYSDYRLQVIEEFRLCVDNKTILNVFRTGKDPIKDDRVYEDETTNEKLYVDFYGIFPISIQQCDKPDNSVFYNNKNNEIKTFRRHIMEIMKGVKYLGPFRKEPGRFYIFPARRLHDVGSRGSKAPELLGADYIQGKGDILKAVSEWFSSYINGWDLSISKQGEGFSLVVTNPDNRSLEVNIADLGAGIAQVLPIVVQRQFEKISGHDNYRVEIIEQPELHLHPGAHGDLADLYVEAVNKSENEFIIETHSENFLLRIRRRIAKGELSPDKVIIYCVQKDSQTDSPSVLRPIYIDKNGDVDWWPKGVFSEDFEELKEIRKAQRKSQ